MFDSLLSDVLGRDWVLAFDGGPDLSQASGPVGREQPADGVWTDDPALVDEILLALGRL